MHRIHRHLVAIRAPQHSSSVYRGRHRTTFLPDCHVSIKRPFFGGRQNLVVHDSVRYFSQILYVAATGQAAQPNEKTEQDDLDSVAHVLQEPENTSEHGIESPGSGRSSAPQRQLSSASPDYAPRLTDQDNSSSRNHKSDLTHPYDDDLPLDEDAFAALDGFWSLRADSLATAASSNTSQTSSRQDVPNERNDPERETPEAAKPIGQEWKDLWWLPTRPGKIDLSHWKPSVGERKGTYLAQPKLDDDPRTTVFRANRGPRKIVDHFLRKYYDRVSPTKGLPHGIATTLLVDKVFAPLKNDTNLIIDILNASWVVSAGPEQRLKRLICLLRDPKSQSSEKFTQWLVLQTLRSERIEAPDFVNLFDTIVTKTGEWSTKASVMVLIVRLVRHARSTSPTSLYTLVEYFVQLLGQHYSSDSTIPDLQDRAHWCNRILRLLAIPTHSNPFMHVRIQQDAQLLLLHHMYDASPPIPLNREGYRALVMLQLMHEKTDVEREWARRQAETWPPWEEQHRMGVTAPPRKVSGITSRVNTVLSRMREDGYSPYSFDVAAQILGGRDSDESPTIQVRRKPSLVSVSSPWLPDTRRKGFHMSSQIWAARVTATRTIREAWMGFCAYETTCEKTAQSNHVYLAMFQKLWARIISAQPDSDLLPGDGVENFPDPELIRDRVHVPEEPPSPEGLYARMRANGIQPSGRMLNQLLQQERHLSRGLAYIDDSKFSPKLREILASPTTHTPDEVAKQLRECHPEFIRGYLGFLARPNTLRHEQKPAYLAGSKKSAFSGPIYALEVLRRAKFSDSLVLTPYIAGLSDHLRFSADDRRKLRLTEVWDCMVHVYNLEAPEIVCTTLPQVLFIAWRFQTARHWPISNVMNDPLEIAKRFFIAAVSGVKVKNHKAVQQAWSHCMQTTCATLRSVPTPDVIQDLAFIMLAAQPSAMIEDILGLLRWMSEHKAQITTISSITKRNLAAFRTYVEGQWVTQGPEFLGQDLQIATPSQIEEAREICEQLGGWPEDQEVEQYLRSSSKMFARLKRKLEKISSIE